MINSQIFKTYSIQQVLDDIKNQVRKKPQDADLRAYLFQLLSLQGNWSKAAEQIKLSAEMNAQAQPQAMIYAGALSAEIHRQAVLQGEERPALFGQAEEWLALLMAALEEKDADKSAMLRQQGLEMAPEVAGTLTLSKEEQHTFGWIADADNRLGPVLEVINNGKYGWLPFSQIQKIRFLQAEGLSDLVWAQAEVTMDDGRSLAMLIPARYSAAKDWESQEDALKLGHRTEWLPLSEDHYQGLGQKMLMTDQADYAMLEISEINIHTTPTP